MIAALARRDGIDGRALRLFLATRVALGLAAWAVVTLFDGHLNPRRGEWDSARLHDLGRLVDVWARWDSDWFLRIAEHGYSWPSSTPAFFPLYPGVVAATGRVAGGHYVLAGVIVSLLAGSTAAVLLGRLTRDHLDETAGLRAVLYLSVVPTSLFLGAVYSEALFLALALATFVLAERGRLGWAGVVAGLAMLTRAQGIALLPALLLYAWPRGTRARAESVAVPLAIFASFPLLLWREIGHPFAFLDAQETVWRRQLSPIGPIGGLSQALRDADLVEVAFAVVMLTLAVVAWKRFGATYGVYALGALLLPMSFPSPHLGGLYSFPRLAIVAFPCFMALAAVTTSRRATVATTAVLTAGLAVFVVRWALWQWVA